MLAGSSVLFRSAAALLEELQRQTPEGRRRKLHVYANVVLLCIDEVGYLSFDDKAADLLARVVIPVIPFLAEYEPTGETIEAETYCV